MEPILEKIESAAFGYYELNLVAFASVDGLSDGCVRSGTWTQNVWRFRQYCESLKFEGSGNGNAICEALVEATYLTRQPSTLGKLENVAQHVLLCTAGSIGRLSVPWPFREHVSHDGDRRVNLLTLLGHMVTTRGLSFSILTAGSPNNILPKKFGTLVGSGVLKMCEKLSPHQNCLMLIHPRWRHGYQALFPEGKEMDEWIETAATSAADSDQNFRTTSPSLPLPPHIRSEAALKPLDIHQLPPSVPPCSAADQMALSIKMGQEFPDAIRLSSWSKAQDSKPSWNDSTTHHYQHHHDQDLSKMSVDGLSSVESELALERDLLQLESTQTSYRDGSSEKESKVESSTSYGGGIASPAHSSTKYSAPSADPSSVVIRDPFATPAAQMAAVLPEDGASSTHSQRIAIAAQRSKTMSSSASVSIETCRKMDELSSQRRSLPRNGVLVEKRAQAIDHRRSWPSPTTTTTEPRNLHDSTRSYPILDDPRSAYTLSSELAMEQEYRCDGIR